MKISLNEYESLMREAADKLTAEQNKVACLVEALKVALHIRANLVQHQAYGRGLQEWEQIEQALRLAQGEK